MSVPLFVDNRTTAAVVESLQVSGLVVPESGSQVFAIVTGDWIHDAVPVANASLVESFNGWDLRGLPTSESGNSSAVYWTEHPALSGMELAVQRVRRMARRLAKESGFQVAFRGPEVFTFGDPGEARVTHASLGVEVSEATREAVGFFRESLYAQIAKTLRPRDCLRLVVRVWRV